MPKKKDPSDSKKSRKTSSTSKDATSASPSGPGEIVPPPNPAATHLVASNPFDDPPSTRMMQTFPGQPMMRMPGPPAVIGPGYPGWSPRGSLRPAYNGSGTPNWTNSMPVNSIGQHPVYQQNIPNNGYGLNRPLYSGGHMPFRLSPRMVVNNVRPGTVPLGSPGPPENMMHEAQTMGPNHMVASGNHGHMLQNTGQMKALTRPPLQNSSPSGTSSRKGSTSSTKNLGGDSKLPKNTEGNTKSRKKSEKKNNADGKVKNGNEGEKQSLNSASDSTVTVAPHAIPPDLPQLCQGCKKEISNPDDTIRCIASCKNWYHRTCVGLTEDALNILKKEEFALWACDLCLQTKEIYSVKARGSRLDCQITGA